METVLILKSKSFDRFALKQRIQDETLRNAIQETEQGLYEADLGGGLIKKRIARQGEGRSGGYRTIILFRRGCLAVYLHGFAKKDKANISADDFAALKRISSEILAQSREELGQMIREGVLVEVEDEG